MCKHASLREMGNEQFTSWLYFHKIVSLSCMCVFFVLFCFFFFHRFIRYSSCNIQYTFIIQHTQKKEKKQKPKRGRCNGTNVLCEAPPLDQDQAQAGTRLGLKLKKISWSPIGNVLERHSHQMHIISCQFVL